MENQLKISGDIIIGDPCVLVASEEDWQLCQWGEHMEKLGIEDFYVLNLKRIFLKLLMTTEIFSELFVRTAAVL